jgi:glyoxylase-like metal-dependent hydrolase (beta-lactamase superfamily II)
MSVELEEARIGPARILFGESRGKYPDANCVLVEGAEERLLLDTTPGLVARGRAAVGEVDRILLTHCHEDHLAGNFLFPEAQVWLHEADRPGIVSIEAMLDVIYGYTGARRARFERLLVEQFHFVAAPGAVGFEDGEVFDLGGGVRVEALHTPGHTRGHCAFRIEPGGLLFLGDIDLSSFGPYYGDAWSDLEEFEASLERAAGTDFEAEHYLSGHHVGLVDPPVYRERLARYAAKIGERESRLLEYLREPRTLDDIVKHRFVYRPQDQVPNADATERVMMGMHLDRLVRRGVVERGENATYHRLP